MSRAAGLALGTVQWGMAYGIANRSGRPAPAAIAELLSLARSGGVTILDTARAYGDSERIIGDRVGDDPAWTVITKLDPKADSPERALHSLAESRSALRRQRLDVLLLHRAHQKTIAGGAIWDALRRERDASRIGRLGVSAGNPTEAWEALEDSDVDCIQAATSLFDQRLVRAGFFQAAVERARTVFVRSVFLQGVAHLQPEELPAHLTALAGPLGLVRNWAAERGCSPGLAFLAFAAGLPEAVVLVGCETPGQFEDNLRNWRDAAKWTAAAERLAQSIPDLPEDALNPALWP